MHRAAQQMVQQGAEVFSDASHLSPETIFRTLLSMPGVGEYTAGAISSFAFDLPYPALDGNVYRVLARLYDCEIAFDTTQGKKHFRQLAEELLDREHPRLFNSAIMEFGALHCTPTSPDCDNCPIQDCCLAHAHHTIYCTPDKRILLHHRTDKDIWQHLYEFPLVESDHLLEVPKGVPTIDLTHILSHQRLHARFHIKKVSELPQIPHTIIIPFSAIDDYALSRLTLRALDAFATCL